MIILGLIIIAVGALLVIKTEWFLQNFGRLSWFEDKLGSDGGSRLGYKLLGIAAIFIGIIFMSGNSANFFTWLLSPLIPKQ
jgi:hypothetical protein